MTVRLIRVSSRRTGKREIVRVYVYDDLGEMREAAARFSPHADFSDALGVCQTNDIERVDRNGTWSRVSTPIIIRLSAGHLGTSVVVHEVTHAAAELYGRTIDREAPAGEHLDCSNETLAYLVGDLSARLVDRLYALGYYSRPS